MFGITEDLPLQSSIIHLVICPKKTLTTILQQFCDKKCSNSSNMIYHISITTSEKALTNFGQNITVMVFYKEK